MTEIERVGMTADQFETAESAIEHGLETFVQVGEALLAIREGRGYRHAGFESFDAYCQKRWHMPRQRAYQLMDAAHVVASVSTIVDTAPPRNEGQARELAPLLREQPESIAEVWQEAVETAPNGHITAAHVQSVVERHREPSAPTLVETIGPRTGTTTDSRVFDDLPSPRLTRAERAYTGIGPLLGWVDTDPTEVAETCAQGDLYDKVEVIGGLVDWLTAVHVALQHRIQQPLTVMHGGKTA